MKPIAGTVIETGVIGHRIRLDTGAVITIPKLNNVQLGDKCFVFFNYTSMEVRNVFSEAEMLAMEDEEPGGQDVDDADYHIPHLWDTFPDLGDDEVDWFGCFS